MRFFALEYHKTHSPGLDCLKKKMEKWPILNQNHGLTPLKTYQFFFFFNTLFLKPTKAFFRARISQNTFSWPRFSKTKKMEKWPILDQDHGLTPLENLKFSTFSTFCFYSPERRFFAGEYYKTHFPGLDCPKRRRWKNGQFWTKTMD